MRVELSDEDIDLILNALQARIYWDLSDVEYRQGGNVQGPGSDDPDMAEEIERTLALGNRLAAQAKGESDERATPAP